MNFSKIKDYLHEKILELTNKKFVEDFNPYKIKNKKKALLYYKCSPKFQKSKIGSTEYQSLGIAKAINKAGFKVTVVDRKSKFKVKKKYDIFIGAFNTGGFKYFDHILKQLQKNTKIIGLSTGANPISMKKEFEKRKRMFFKRNKIKLNHMTRYASFNFNNIYKKIDYLIYFGYPKGFVDKSYKNFKLKADIQPCISDNIKIKKKKLLLDTQRNFIYYSGSGFLHKGLDLILEFFIKNKELKLYICSASNEKKFLKFYNLEMYENIFFKGNIKEDSNEARKIFNKCGYIISMNCSGGGSAALAVGRRYGLIPLVWKNEDCNPKACFFINKESYNGIKETIIKISKLKKLKYLSLSKKNQIISKENTSVYYNKRLFRIFKNIE